MKEINKWMFSVCFSIVVVLSQVIVTQWMWINHLNRQVDLVSHAKDIESDMVQDLMMQLSNVKSENLTIGSQQFVAGVVAAIQTPDHFNEIWHAGYDRGMETMKYAEDAEKRSSYTNKKN